MSTPEPVERPPMENLVATWRRVVTDPVGFFADMPEAGGLGQPAAFLALCVAANGLGHLLTGGGLGGAVGRVAAQVIGAVVSAVLFVLIAQHLFGGRAGFEPTFRVVAYAAAPRVFLWVPLVGVLAWAYSAYLTVRGLERVHALDVTRAVLTLVLGVGVLWLLSAARSSSVLLL
jgi:hypothetical protein